MSYNRKIIMKADTVENSAGLWLIPLPLQAAMVSNHYSLAHMLEIFRRKSDSFRQISNIFRLICFEKRLLRNRLRFQFFRKLLYSFKREVYSLCNLFISTKIH